jgi:phosphohistidine swiveling domain-containing protein
LDELEAIDPVHTLSPAAACWSRINAEEAFPGVAKPLCWDFFGAGTNRCWRAMLLDFGLLREGEHLPGDADTGYLYPFYGRPSINMDRMMTVMGLFPGDMAGDHAKELFSHNPAGAVGSGQKRGAPGIDRAKFEVHRRRIRRIVIAEHEDLYQWWREQTSSQTLADQSGSTARYFEALRRYESAQKNHSGNSTLCQHAFSSVARLAEEVGEPGASKLTTGFGDTIDTRAMADLWRVSRGQLAMADFLSVYGYQCSSGDDISELSWRENPRSLEALAETYARIDETASPSASESKRAAERMQVESRILASLPPERHAAVRALLADLQEATRVREMGKASYKMALDAGRAASRARGKELVELGAIDRMNDVYFLTEAEAFWQPTDFRSVVIKRKIVNDGYSKLEIPACWTGNPTPKLPTESGPTDHDGTVTGIGAGAGIAEGRVQLVLHHDTAESMEPGDILVAHTTDPSWGPYFVVAGAVVIDIGGRMSHGAIIARELGIPCVINTGDGTMRLKSGDWVRVDGNAGTVTIVRRAA